MTKTIYVLSGLAPEKIFYVNHRKHHGIKTVLMDNLGDDYNTRNFEYLIENKILDVKSNYVLIICEYQLDYITKNQKIYNWFLEHRDQFITPHFYIDDKINWYTVPNYLSKHNIVKLLKQKFPEIVTQCTFMSGKDFNDLPNEQKLNKIAKEAIGAGSRTITVFKDQNNFAKLEDNKEYLIEDFIEQSGSVRFLEGTMLVTSKNELSMIIDYQPKTLLHGEFGAHGTRIYHKDYWLIKDAMLKIQNILGITKGLYDPEFFFDTNTKKIYLLDLNPRWAGYHSCIDQMAKEWLPRNFDMLYYTINNKPFYKTVESRLAKLPLEGPPLYLIRSWETLNDNNKLT